MSDWKKHWHYLRYVLRHKRLVLEECRKRGIPWRGVLHDMSKFSRAEWGPYADYFYGKWPTYAEASAFHRAHYGSRWTREWAQRRFDAAWLHHIHRNTHHWQHWLLHEDDGEVKALDMPYACILEMVADWWGANRAIHGPPADDNPLLRYDGVQAWYRENRDKLILSEWTRWQVERLLYLPYEERTFYDPYAGHTTPPSVQSRFLQGEEWP